MNYLLNIETTYINIGCKLHALAQAFDIYFAKQYFPWRLKKKKLFQGRKKKEWKERLFFLLLRTWFI